MVTEVLEDPKLLARVVCWFHMGFARSALEMGLAIKLMVPDKWSLFASWVRVAAREQRFLLLTSHSFRAAMVVSESKLLQ